MGIGIDRLVMFLTNQQSIQEVLFFPQMKPEKKAPTIELNENEKLVLEILKKEGTLELSALKEKSGLSNKQWDKTIKGLTKNKLAQVSKIDENLMVNLN